ncbi:methyltransferase domain-containing protein [Blastococcus sp. KM273128]|uniref:class I SAM-dependent methyltransferase n=1 Tax=Blastococcus sp. KM273128 TaxID=2570314 RepID=UPI001F1D1733|nr:class I SAM-dependent methyltransferase [Blastococcus sp. KM273128]MCF6744583.1 methyltransferase domain-containing protein [Blastococcus sp. KM273128]
MSAISRVSASERGLVFAVHRPAGQTVDVLVDGRRIWSFRVPEEAAPSDVVPEGADHEPLRFEPWPGALRSRLRGRFHVELRPVGDEVGSGTTVVLGDPGEEPDLSDIHGRPLVVNKWGRLGHTLADAGPGMVERLLDHTDEIRDLLRERLGPVVFVTGGTLLGPVRDGGRLIPHDDDTDLAYLSSRTHPADVALEHFELGRLLRERGYEPVRHSAAHVQVHFSHAGVPDHYVDVFAGFYVGDWWYQHFVIRAKVPPSEVVPPSEIRVVGRPEPAPRNPETMLRELYGPGWRTPDPAFAFELPESTSARFAHWFGDYLAERETWDDVVLVSTGALLPAEDHLSTFGAEVDALAPADHAILELGCGLGVEARAFAGRGRRVLAVDFSRAALEVARSREAGPGADVEFSPVNLLDVRAAIRLGARCAAEGRPWTVYGRRLLNALDPIPRENLFRLCDMVLRRGGTAHFDLADPGYPGVPPHLRLTVDQVVREAGDRGLVLERADRRTEPLTWPGAPEEQLVEMTRMTFRRRAR